MSARSVRIALGPWLATLCCSLLAACSPGPETLVLSGPTMGTTYTVRMVRASGLPSASTLRERIEAELERIDALASRYRPDSEISRFNASSSTEWIEVSPDLVTVVNFGQTVSRESERAFDVTIAPAVDAWGFGPKVNSKLPAEEALQAAQRAMGPHLLATRLHPPALRKQVPALAIDLNAIVPGFAVDRLHAVLASTGAENFLVDIGGEIRVRGLNGRGEPWRIAIEDPRASESRAYASLQLVAGAVATSGGYRRFLERDGRRDAHVIDARTALPVDANLGAVVVVSDSAMHADAWSTALYVLGPEEGMRIAREHGIAALFLRPSHERMIEVATPEFAQTAKYHRLNPNYER